MRHLPAIAATAILVGILMQFQSPSVKAVSLATAENPAALPMYTQPAPPKPVAKPAAEPVQYRDVKVCGPNGCRIERRPIANVVGKVTGTDCSCGCGCSSCNCGYQPVKQADPVRRSFFGRRFSGRGLFGGRLFSGRLFGRGCCR